MGAGFKSIDCGASKDYLDEVTWIWYRTDEGFSESGTNHGLAPNISFNNYAPTINRHLMTVRSFVEGERNCYTPVFDLYLGVNWTTVRTFLNGPHLFPTEIIMQHDGTREMVQVCLVNTEQGTPFINALLLGPLNSSPYPAPLLLIMDFTFPVRMDLGSGLMPTNTSYALPNFALTFPFSSRFFVLILMLITQDFVINLLARAEPLLSLESEKNREQEYEDDVYDRLWWNNDNTDWDLLKTREEAKVEDSLYELPREVLRTASQPQNHSTLLTANFSYWRYGDVSAQYYMFLRFAEIEKLPAGHKRIINVTFDDDENSLSHELTLRYLKPITLISNKITKGHINSTIKAATNSYAPPILNAFEIYKVTEERTVSYFRVTLKVN
ncbi:putative leucine-rich repeat receptor-like protein kinase At2g19210 [Neltuma alba]|uniref:putative leucine-rich repeat receptor-like protein kinase At2g19210 n=1 Tax=Neltuma alba TaxID=207710 RepID=UPI0010A344E1|nr:putative leucine-rich repeat receptor-like protein kinase At2g19210 [Prosopis alba]